MLCALVGLGPFALFGGWRAGQILDLPAVPARAAIVETTQPGVPPTIMTTTRGAGERPHVVSPVRRSPVLSARTTPPAPVRVVPTPVPSSAPPSSAPATTTTTTVETTTETPPTSG